MNINAVRSSSPILRSLHHQRILQTLTPFFKSYSCVIRSKKASKSRNDFPATAKYFSSTKHTSADSSGPDRPRRSLLSVPGCDARKLTKAVSVNADAMVLDLEDGVPYTRKDEARAMVLETLESAILKETTSEVCVRVNGLETGDLAIQDLEAILSAPSSRLHAIVLPKVEHSSQIEFVKDMLETKQPNADIRILAAIESAKGMINLREIVANTAKSSYPQLDALIFASEDYCADLELIRTPEATELLWARSELVTTAKAYGLQAIDMVHIDFRNLADLRRECQRGREMGFTGKQAIHPMQLETIHQSFVPSTQDIQFAQECVEKYEHVTEGESGQGACVVQGIVVDTPVYKWAQRILQRAHQAGLLNEGA